MSKNVGWVVYIFSERPLLFAHCHPYTYIIKRK